MASLYERLMGVHPSRPKIPIHQFQACTAEWVRGQLTGAQANTVIESVSGIGLDATEQTEVQDLVATVPIGTTAANKADRALRLIEIDQILLLCESGTFAGPVAVRARLGVPTR